MPQPTQGALLTHDALGDEHPTARVGLHSEYRRPVRVKLSVEHIGVSRILRVVDCLEQKRIHLDTVIQMHDREAIGHSQDQPRDRTRQGDSADGPADHLAGVGPGCQHRDVLRGEGYGQGAGRWEVRVVGLLDREGVVRDRTHCADAQGDVHVRQLTAGQRQQEKQQG